MRGNPWGNSGFIITGVKGPGIFVNLSLWQTSVKQSNEGPMVGCSVRSFGVRLRQIQGAQQTGRVEKEFSSITHLVICVPFYDTLEVAGPIIMLYVGETYSSFGFRFYLSGCI